MKGKKLLFWTLLDGLENFFALNNEIHQFFQRKVSISYFDAQYSRIKQTFWIFN